MTDRGGFAPLVPLSVPRSTLPGRGRHGRREQPDMQWPPEIRAAVIALVKRGVPRWKIERFFLISPNTVRQWMRASGRG